MSETTFPAECQSNLRRARVEAKWSLRHYRREFGNYTTLNLVHDIRMASWLSERIRAEGPSLPPPRLQHLQAHLLRKLALAEIVIKDLLGDPFEALTSNN